MTDILSSERGQAENGKGKWKISPLLICQCGCKGKENICVSARWKPRCIFQTAAGSDGKLFQATVSSGCDREWEEFITVVDERAAFFYLSDHCFLSFTLKWRSCDYSVNCPASSGLC